MNRTHEKLSCDVLIAGGGIGGLVCAVELKEKKPELDVLVVEKQFAGYGGKANKGGGVLQYFRDDVDPMQFLGFHVNEIGGFLGDQELMLKYMKMNHEMIQKLSDWGAHLPKKEDGTFAVIPTGPFTAMIIVDLDICLQMRRKAEKLGVRFLDKTTVAELYTDGHNRICGAAAYSILDDGTFYTISAKKVVLATGSQNYRIGSMWSNGRGDGIAAAWRAGAEMRNAEFGNFAQLMRASTHHEIVYGENFMYNAKNEHVTKNFTDHRPTDIPSVAIREWYLNMKNGTGPIHLDFGPPVEGGFKGLPRGEYGAKFHELNEQDAMSTGNDLEVCPLLIGEQSCIRVGHDMQTSVNGLYAIGDCSYCGSGAPGAVPAPPGRNRGSGILNAVFAGILCGDAMAESDLSPAPAIRDEDVEACRAAVYAPLERAEGCGAKEVIALVQKAMAPMDYSVYMKQDRMEEAVKFVEQARAKVNSMKAVDMHDLLSCHEAAAMVLSAEMHFKAAMARHESRGWFLREDYPEMDNKNWLKWIILQNKDGEMTMRTEDVPIEKWPIQPPKA